MKDSSSFSFNPIGYVESCFKQKFGIPRQPGLVPSARGRLILLPEYSHPDIIRGLSAYSHIWIIFVFHQSIQEKFKNTVRPPRLGGNERMGVFATRSNFRPNPIGQSVVMLEKVDMENDRIVLSLSGIDILDKTPVLDIKPYITYSDYVEKASAGFAFKAPEKQFTVSFSAMAENCLQQLMSKDSKHLKTLITEVLSYDPRPAYETNKENHKIYSMQLYDYDVKWRVEGEEAMVEEIVKR